MRKLHLRHLILVLSITLIFSIALSFSMSPAGAGTSPLLKIHFLDVGQADSILVQSPTGKTMLVDAGNNDDGPMVVAYLKKQGIEKLDILVGTHPHEDHIGGLDDVIKNIDIGKLYMPKVSHTTKTFNDVLTAIKTKGLKVSTASAGVQLDLGGDMDAKMLAPKGDSYDDMNDYSSVIKLKYKSTSFLLTGDAGEVSEGEMLSKGFDLNADILKVGHHGSRYSTSERFLKAVSPEYAVICTGKGNDYGHPHKETLGRLATARIKVYRTDMDGTVIASSDGKNITFNKKASYSSSSKATPTPYKIKAPNPGSSNTIVYITTTGEKYHKSGCQYLSKSKIPIKLKDAKARSYTPCSRCKPPS